MDTSLTFVLLCLRVNNGLRMSEAHRIRFIVFPKHKLCGFVDGIGLDLRTLGDIAR